MPHQGEEAYFAQHFIVERCSLVCFISTFRRVGKGWNSGFLWEVHPCNRSLQLSVYLKKTQALGLKNLWVTANFCSLNLSFLLVLSLFRKLIKIKEAVVNRGPSPLLPCSTNLHENHLIGVSIKMCHYFYLAPVAITDVQNYQKQLNVSLNW